MIDKIEKSTEIEKDAPKHAMRTAVRLFGQLNNQKRRHPLCRYFHGAEHHYAVLQCGRDGFTGRYSQGGDLDRQPLHYSMGAARKTARSNVGNVRGTGNLLLFPGLLNVKRCRKADTYAARADKR